MPSRVSGAGRSAPGAAAATQITSSISAAGRLQIAGDRDGEQIGKVLAGRIGRRRGELAQEARSAGRDSRAPRRPRAGAARGNALASILPPGCMKALVARLRTSTRPCRSRMIAAALRIGAFMAEAQDFRAISICSAVAHKRETPPGSAAHRSKT